MPAALNNSEDLAGKENKIYKCPRREALQLRIHRSFFVKTILFWLP
jgi:hypothetical protein